MRDGRRVTRMEENGGNFKYDQSLAPTQVRRRNSTQVENAEAALSKNQRKKKRKV